MNRIGNGVEMPEIGADSPRPEGVNAAADFERLA
jgi:hypothetical protein